MFTCKVKKYGQKIMYIDRYLVPVKYGNIVGFQVVEATVETALYNNIYKQ